MEDFTAVENLLRELGAYQLEGYRRLERGGIQVKDDSSHGLSVVTEYDIGSEKKAANFIAQHFPGDSFLGEESGNVRRDPRRYWVLDPIDGTSNYTQGVVYWGPTLAFWDRLGPAAGWIFMPAIDQFFHARRGEGAFLNGERLHASRATEYSDLVTVATTSRLHRRLHLSVPAKHRILGSLIVNLAYLASGTFVASFGRGNVWDIAAGVLIAREAGAVVECRPALETIDLSRLDPKSATGITVYGRANESLPSLERYLAPPAPAGQGPAGASPEVR